MGDYKTVKRDEREGKVLHYWKLNEMLVFPFLYRILFVRSALSYTSRYVITARTLHGTVKRSALVDFSRVPGWRWRSDSR